MVFLFFVSQFAVYSSVIILDYTMLTRLYDNYAIRRLQELFITQLASQVLFQQGILFMEQEMSELDNNERVDRPPRHIK